MRRPSNRSLAGGAVGIAAGVLAGIALAGGSAGGASPPDTPDVVEVAHVPPLLTLAGERVVLRYALVCTPRSDGASCNGSGEVYLRQGHGGEFRRLALKRDDDSSEGRYFTVVPPEIAQAHTGFSYYAVLRDDDTGASVTVPSGGAEAPNQSFPMRDAVSLELGPHAFGRTRARDARVVSAGWGGATAEVGLAGSRELGFTGPSAFDVDRGGTVTLLDQVNRRLLRWRNGVPAATTLDVSGGLADLAVESDGTVNVLEPPNRTTPAPMLKSFTPDGAQRWAQRLADRTWAKLELGPAGPVVLQQPSEQWLPASERGRALGRREQARKARSGRPAASGEVIVERVGESELRLAEAAGNAIVWAWRIRSDTSLGEVQLAERFGGALVVVVRVYSEERDEYDVLILRPSGELRRFSLPATEWAEAAPLARVRLAGPSLYQLGSTATELFVDRFDLEVPR